MAEAEGRFTKARLEAFSDGVIAVIVTIMVLDLKAPEGGAIEDLIRLWPAFSIYLVSYVFMAIYWINHHSLLNLATRVTPALIWSNNVLLFCLSLIPFSTAYVANTHLAPLPTMLYGGLQLLCGLGYALTLSTIVYQRRNDRGFRERTRPRQRKNFISLGVYAVSVVVAAFSPTTALAVYLLVGVAYIAPGLFADPAGEMLDE